MSQPGKDNIIIDESLKIINEAGRRLITNKKADIMDEKRYAQEKEDKDLLSLLSEFLGLSGHTVAHRWPSS